MYTNHVLMVYLRGKLVDWPLSWKELREGPGTSKSTVEGCEPKSGEVLEPGTLPCIPPLTHSFRPPEYEFWGCTQPHPESN